MMMLVSATLSSALAATAFLFASSGCHVEAAFVTNTPTTFTRTTLSTNAIGSRSEHQRHRSHATAANRFRLLTYQGFDGFSNATTAMDASDMLVVVETEATTGTYLQ